MYCQCKRDNPINSLLSKQQKQTPAHRYKKQRLVRRMLLLSKDPQLHPVAYAPPPLTHQQQRSNVWTSGVAVNVLN
jgi:hypothetical protein